MKYQVKSTYHSAGQQLFCGNSLCCCFCFFFGLALAKRTANELNHLIVGCLDQPTEQKKGNLQACHHFSPCLQDLSKAWWLLCQPSPKATMPTSLHFRRPECPDFCAFENQNLCFYFCSFKQLLRLMIINEFLMRFIFLEK